MSAPSPRAVNVLAYFLEWDGSFEEPERLQVRSTAASGEQDYMDHPLLAQ